MGEPKPRRRTRRLVLRIAVAGAVAAVALGFLGAFAAPFDSFAHFRAHLAAGLVVLALAALLLRLPWSAGLAAAVAVAGFATTLPYLLPRAQEPGEGAVYTLLQMNLRWDAEGTAGAIRRIAEAQPDVVTLQEISPRWRQALAPLAEGYPHQLYCEEADGFLGDSAILSRRPFAEGTGTFCDAHHSLAAARVDFNGTDVTVASHHQLWPWPMGQWPRLDALRPALQALPEPVLLGGDFNAAPWSALLADYTGLTGTRVVHGVGATWFPSFLPAEWARGAGLAIDHVLVSPQIGIVSAQRMEATASDHLPVLVRFTVARTPPAAPEVQVVNASEL